MKRALVALVLVVVTGCGGAPEGYLRAKSAGDRAKSSGRYDEAARAYEQAAREAKTPHERDEVLYLAASTWAQAGRSEEAMRTLDALVAASPRGERAERAAYDRAYLEIERGDEAKGWEMLERTLFEHPNAGSDRRALRKLIDHQPPGSGLAWLDARMDRLAKTELAEDAQYLRAALLRIAGRRTEARDAFVRCAEQHPYPRGTLVDDAWWNAAELEVELGAPQRAIDDLRRLLSVRESSSLGQGSYERPRYSPAQMKIAEIYRDKLGDERAARVELHALYTNHRTSILRAEALFEEARLAKKAGDRSAACDATSHLVDELGESRYAGCAAELCDGAKPSTKAPACRPYLRARIVGAPPPPADGDPASSKEDAPPR